jgi:4-hydroxythreonine-4-phosphate dehydrogenase
MYDTKIKIGITHGDINGIGYEIIIKTLMEPRMQELFIPIIYGSPKVAAYHRKAMNVENFSFNHIKTIEEAHPKRANILNCVDENIRVELGRSTPAAGEASFMALAAAVKDLKENKIDALVTCPINKYNIQSEKFSFPGHTEYLKKEFNADEVLMLLVSDVMKVGVVTGHVPIAKVSENITQENILKKLRILNTSLISDFGIRKPRIAVLGLNPHSGDNGVIGDEELTTIIPSIEKARKENIIAIGPFAADGFFGSGEFKKFDAVLAMYHDQGLAPFKSIVFDYGVNYTAGLPIIRTSPDHGTAYELAGKNEASPESLRQAIYLAIELHKNRHEYKEAMKNQIKNYDITNL